MSTQAVITQSQQKMEKSLTALQGELSKQRTGRASLNVLDGIRVNYYGAVTPVNQVASLSVPEARLIVIQPWESHLIPEIEKAILEANIGLTPTNDGKVVRLNIPKLTEERRRDIVKQIKTLGEDAKVTIRHARRDANEEIKQLKNNSQIAEDEMKKSQDRIQKLTDEYVDKIDRVIDSKEQDIMTV